jgi:hypothetical protein
LHADQQAAAQAAAGAARESLALRAQVAEQTAAVQAGAQQLKALQARLDQAEAQGRAALAENEPMLLQLHQVQEELEHYYLECRKLEAAAASIPSMGLIEMSAAEVLPVPLKAKQKLMELSDARTRLDILMQYLRQHKIIA